MGDDEGSLVSAESLQPRVVLRHGCASPPEVTAVAYDAGQQLLALALHGGSLHLFGGAGEEAVLQSDCTEPSRLLLLLPDQPLLLRLSASSELEVWDLRRLQLHASALWPEDVTSVCAMHGGGLLLLGLASGALSVVRLSGGALEERGAFDVGSCAGAGAVVALAPQPGGADGRVLVAWADGALCLICLAAKTAVATGSSAGSLVCAVWLDATTFTTGHTGGLVRLWSLPDAASATRTPPPRAAELSVGGMLGLGDGAVMLVACGDLIAALCQGQVMLINPACLGAAPTALTPPSSSVPCHLFAAGDTGSPVLLALSNSEPALLAHSMDAETAWAAIPLGYSSHSLTCAVLKSGAAPLLGVLRGARSAPSALASTVFRRAPSLQSGSSRLLISGHHDGSVRFTDASGAALSVLWIAETAAGSVVALDVCTKLVTCAVATREKVVVITLDGATSASYDPPAEPTCVVLISGASAMAVGTTNGSVRIVGLPSRDELRAANPFPDAEAPSHLLAAHSTAGAPLLLVLGQQSTLALLPFDSDRVAVSKPSRAAPPCNALALYGAFIFGAQ